MYTEQGVLRVSIWLTVFTTVIGITFGLLAGSLTIVFDGFYELIDLAMTMLALLVARLIAMSAAGNAGSRKLTERFTMGFWHLEPMLLGLNGTLLIAAATYALINSISAILTGGRSIAFDYALIYAVVSLVVEVSMAVFVTKANRSIGSDLLALDAKGWAMSAAMTVAYCVAFGFGMLAQGTTLEWMTPYIDPVALALVCLVTIPVPFGTVRQALADIFLVTPADLKAHVDSVARQTVERHGFVSFRSYVARVGRGRQIELYFIAPTEWPARRLEEWDALRAEIGEALGERSPDRWLTIVFTTDPEWAD